MSHEIALTPELEDYARLAIRQHAADVDAADVALRQRINTILGLSGALHGSLHIESDRVVIRVPETPDGPDDGSNPSD